VITRLTFFTIGLLDRPQVQVLDHATQEETQMTLAQHLVHAGGNNSTWSGL